MSEAEAIQAVERETTDAEWVDVIYTAMDADLDRALRNRVVAELLDMRRAQVVRRSTTHSVHVSSNLAKHAT